jgi:type II secretory pathway component GspD/PulD (secretin)
VINNRGKKVGVDWSTTLGEGLTVSASQSLNAMFNLPDTSVLTKANSTIRDFTNGFDNTSTFTGTTGALGSTAVENITTSTGSVSQFDSREHNSTYNDGPGLVFEPLQVSAIIRALEENGIVSQESCPTIITEDNEQGIISVVDRFPIITSTITETTAGQNITEELRYKIDEEDPDAMENPEKSREIGVTLSVTPTLLPDGTVRMKLRPRVAKIVEFIPGQTGNIYPRVSESTAEAISRIPAGQSLILGGFYDYSETKNKNNVPLLGKVPGLGWLFKSKDNSL